ncbi:MAG: heavy metal-associated domain-containing protein [Desulfomonile sp.]|jgi:copper chaperone|nr:heavy metal-associated domain-containing protein [Deltaproteobacteria bacterium]
MVTTVNIKGMSCNHCVTAVTKVLNGIEGVADVNVDLENACATFEHAEAMDVNDIKQRIEKAGYEVG